MAEAAGSPEQQPGEATDAWPIAAEAAPSAAPADPLGASAAASPAVAVATAPTEAAASAEPPSSTPADPLGAVNMAPVATAIAETSQKSSLEEIPLESSCGDTSPTAISAPAAGQQATAPAAAPQGVTAEGTTASKGPGSDEGCALAEPATAHTETPEQDAARKAAVSGSMQACNAQPLSDQVDTAAAAVVGSSTNVPAQALRMRIHSSESDNDSSPTTSQTAAPDFLTADGAAVAAVVPPGSNHLQDVRRRFQFLNGNDQKTTVRRECQKAATREEALLAQLQSTIASYSEALECSSFSLHSGDREGPVITPEVAAKYQERIKFLQGTAALLEEEPTLSLPKLTPLEAASGMLFASYASTASVVKGVGDEAGVSEPVAAGASFAASSVRNAFSFLRPRDPTSEEALAQTNSDSFNNPPGIETFVAPEPLSPARAAAGTAGPF